jgi:hypothetical protein
MKNQFFNSLLQYYFFPTAAFVITKRPPLPVSTLPVTATTAILTNRYDGGTL